jgi:hypothetical protein
MESGAWRAFSRGDGMTDIAPLDLFDSPIKKINVMFPTFVGEHYLIRNWLSNNK